MLLALSSCTGRQHKPNILLINVDDLGWRDLGIMGSAYYETPVIDSLLRAGIIFDNAYAAAANRWPAEESERAVQSAKRLVVGSGCSDTEPSQPGLRST